MNFGVGEIVIKIYFLLLISININSQTYKVIEKNDHFLLYKADSLIIIEQNKIIDYQVIDDSLYLIQTFVPISNAATDIGIINFKLRNNREVLWALDSDRYHEGFSVSKDKFALFYKYIYDPEDFNENVKIYDLKTCQLIEKFPINAIIKEKERFYTYHTFSFFNGTIILFYLDSDFSVKLIQYLDLTGKIIKKIMFNDDISYDKIIENESKIHLYDSYLEKIFVVDSIR